jgi:hypothetical protein
MLETPPARKLNDDDYVDYSKWCGYFNCEVIYMSNANLEMMIKDLSQELDDRKLAENENADS